MYYYYIYAETFMDDINTHSLNHTYMYMYIYVFAWFWSCKTYIKTCIL